MKITFSAIEVRDLVKAWIMTAIAFGIASAGLNMGLVVAIPIALVTGGISLILHELMHKFTAGHFDIHSEFRANNMMLIASVFVSLLGWVFLAPGAVFMPGSVDTRRNGIIASAGPLTNIVLAVISLAVLVWTSVFVPALAASNYVFMLFVGLAAYSFRLNAWIGLFNMLPFMGLDGEKVLAWKPVVFWTMAIVAAGLSFAGFYFNL